MKSVSFTVPASAELNALASLPPAVLGPLLQGISSALLTAPVDSVSELRETLARERQEFSGNIAAAFREGARVDAQFRQLDASVNATKAVIEKAFGSPGAPCEKGVAGENLVREWLLRTYPLAGITNVSAIAGSMDLVAVIRQGTSELKIVIEIKNKAHVTKADRDKFERDVSENKQEADAAVLISLRHENIANRGEFQVASINNVVVVYIARAAGDDFAVLRSTIDMLLHAKQVDRLRALGPDTESVCNMLSTQARRNADARRKIAEGMALVEEGYLLLAERGTATTSPLTELLTGMRAPMDTRKATTARKRKSFV